MKLHADAQTALNTVTAYGPEGISINGKLFETSLVTMPEGAIQSLQQRRFEELDEAFFAELGSRKPEVVILGTGKRQRFAHPRLTNALSAKGIGVEYMDTAAALRTYNILMAEGRQVLGAFILEVTN